MTGNTIRTPPTQGIENMFSGIRRLLGNVKITQTEHHITISGIPADVMANDIARLWRTQRINNHMFVNASKNSLTFPLFFAPDVYYMLDQLIEYRNRRVNARVLTKIRDTLQEQSWLMQTDTDAPSRVDMRKINNLIYKPLDYQQLFFETYDNLTSKYNLRGYLLAAAAGSGKTYMAYALAEMLGSEHIVVFSPKNAIEEVWEAEVNKLFKKTPSYWMEVSGKPYNKERVIIVHYESLKNVMTLAKQLRGKRVTVVLDESHNFNDLNSQRSALYQKFLEEVDATDVIWASGTPIKAMGAESIPLLRAIDPLFTEDVEQRYRKIFGRDGSKGLDILKHRIGFISYKVEKHQLGLDRPVIKRLPVVIKNGKDFTLTTVRREMEAFIKERYAYYKERRKEDHAFYVECLKLHEDTLRSKTDQQAFKQYQANVKLVRKYDGDARVVAEEIKATNRYEKEKIHPSLPQSHRKKFQDVKSIVKYLNLKIQGEALGRVVGRKRIECHVAMVPEIDFKGVCGSTPKKTVVFTSFVQALEETNRHLTAKGMSPLMVYGKTNADLKKTVDLFKNQEDLNPLVATFQSLSTAVPLVMADTMIMINAPFRAYIHEQAVSRIHRLGADTQTTVWECYLDTGDEPNISTRSSDILAWSQQQVEAIMGIKSPFDYSETSGGVTVSSETYSDVEVSVNIADVKAVAKLPAYMEW